VRYNSCFRGAILFPREDYPVIDCSSESVITFSQAADSIPRRRRGCKCHVSTLFRWSTAGCRGVVLETIQIGGTRCTSQEALQRFFERLSRNRPNASVGRGLEPAKGAPALGIRTAARHKRESDQASRLLEQSGA
jgi:hypothetical protein